MKARILKSAKRVFDCEIIDSEEKIQAIARGNLLKADAIVVGDFVEVAANKDEFEIVSVHVRKNEVFRMLIRENKKKVIASNVDLLVIVMSVSKPDFKRGLVDRYLARAFQWQTPAIVIFNKMDEFDEQIDPIFEAHRLKEIEADCYEVSSKVLDYKPQFLKNGIEELKDIIKGKTALFVGHSGVGKSKLITALTNQEIKLLSGKLAKKVDKGAHTTSWAELIRFEEFDFIDSPGIRTLSLEDIPLPYLDECFPDVAEAANNCKFRDCTHSEESKGCYFNTLDFDDIDDLGLMTRLESYIRIKSEASKIPEWQKSKG